MKNSVTYDEVYEIAAEVCEDMITKFLKNLVKLVPVAEGVVDDIQEQQYEELKALRQEKLRRQGAGNQLKESAAPQIKEDDFGLLGGDDFNAISHPDSVVEEGEDSSWADKNDMDSALGQMDLPPMGSLEDQ